MSGPFSSRAKEQLLAEVRHLLGPMRLVESDDVGQRLDRRRRPQGLEIRGEIGLELVQQHLQLALVVLAGVRDLRGIDQHGAPPDHLRQRVLHEPVHAWVEPEGLPDDADARAAQAVRIQEPGVVRHAAARRVRRRRVAVVRARDQRAEEDGGIADGARHGPRRVLAVRDGDDPRAADESERGLDADDAVRGRRADDRAVRLRADGEARRGSRPPRPPEPELEPQGLRSSTYGFFACPPRALQPLLERVERMLAHSLRFALPSRTAPASRRRARHRRVSRRDGAGQGERARGRRRPVRGVDVVLQQDRDAVQRAAQALRAPLRVQRLRDRERIRVHLDDVVERGTLAVQGGDAR